jgi:hypothetical protein
MRASPYDLRLHGFEPVAIETKAGREEYTRVQRELAGRAAGLRTRVLAEYRGIRSSKEGTAYNLFHNRPTAIAIHANRTNPW